MTPTRPAALLAVLLLHLLLLAAWRAALRTPATPPQSAPVVSYLRLPPPPPAEQRPVVEAPAAPARALVRSRLRPPTRAVEPMTNTPALQAITLPPTAADQASPAPMPAEPRLLDTPATRRALRELAPHPADDAPVLSASERLGQAIGSGVVGDCLKGEYAGVGMGLLSAPFLALAALRGDCRR